MSFLKAQVIFLKEFLRSGYRKFLFWCAVGMVFSMAAGCLVYMASPEAADEIITQFMEMVLEAGVIDQETGAVSVFALLQNNWTAMITIILYGFFPFLYLPVISLFSNGALMGVLAGMYWHAEELTMGMFLAGILPHGIFEIPALLLSAACGVMLCRNAVRVITRKQPVPMVALLSDLLRVLVLVIAPLTVAAALIEAYVTPLILAMFL